jgi:hypothetical protein
MCQVLIQPQDGAWTSSQVDRKVPQRNQTRATSSDHRMSRQVIWADADFSGNWHAEMAMDDPDTARRGQDTSSPTWGSRVWKSLLQTEIASAAANPNTSPEPSRSEGDSNHRASPRDEADGFPLGDPPTVKCKLFEDNSGAMTLAKSPAMRPRTKHINVKYHHFRSFVMVRYNFIVQVSGPTG